MNVLLTMIPQNIEFRDQQKLYFPLSIYLLASYVRNAGHEVSISCFPDPATIKYDDWGKFDLVGFSCNTFNYADSCEVAEKLKSVNSNIKILFGGIHVTHFPEDALKKEYIDLVIRGEGEDSFVKLLKTNLKNELFSEVPGLSYKIDEKFFHNKLGSPIVLDSSTLLPAYDLIKGNLSNIPFETSRGCQNKCTFCSIDHKYKWRGFSEDVIMDRLDQCLSWFPNKNSIKSIATTDDCFTTDTKRAKKILKAITKKYPEIPLRIEARIRDLLFDDELVDALAECNLGMLQIGVECGYDEGLKRIRKGISTEDVRKCAEKLSKRGVGRSCFFSYIIAMPWENKDDCHKTLSFAEEIFEKYRIPGNSVLWLPLPSVISEEYGLARSDWYNRKGWWYDNEIFFESHANIKQSDFGEIMHRNQMFIQESLNYLGIIM